jgi:DGQHR domain-containing protein
LINEWDDFGITEESTIKDYFNVEKPDYLSFLQKENETYYLIIPFTQKSVLVIDGQHRLEGLRGLKGPSEAIQENYDLLLAFIIGYDRSVVAKQFYTINYEQKPVNKSLLYQLQGEFSRDVNELSFLHNVVKLLNELEGSPFLGRIKMLGKTPKNLPADGKRKLSISQAFLIDSMIRFISVKAKGTLYPPIFLKYFRDTKSHIIIVRSIARFFSAVKSIKNDWEHPEESLLSKGMAVGALLKVFNFLIPIVFSKELGEDWSKLDELKVAEYIRFLQGLEKVDFSTNGPYGKTSSEGGLSKMKSDIILNLPYFGTFATIKEFETDYKTNFLPAFNSALDKVS